MTRALAPNAVTLGKLLRLLSLNHNAEVIGAGLRSIAFVLGRR
jgi:hypothetical protein